MEAKNKTELRKLKRGKLEGIAHDLGIRSPELYSKEALVLTIFTAQQTRKAGQ